MFGFSVNAAMITHVELTSVSDNSMVVTWSTTDEASTTEILYGIGSLTESSSLAGTSNYHYLELNNLYANTTYQYRVKSGNTLYPPEPFPPLNFTTLQRPSGEYLFSFAVLNDFRYAEGKSNVQGARGIPYQYCAEILTAEVSDINERGVAFTVINGNLSDSDTATTYGDQLGNNVKPSVENLNGATDLPSGAGYKYLPVPGYEDKNASYSNDWISDGFEPLTADPGTSESRYGYSATNNDDTKDAIFNYQFKYKYYNFIFLDSTRSDGSGLASLEALGQYLSAESNSKTFIFMAYPGYDPFGSGTSDYPVEIPTSEVSGGIFTIDNHADFRTTIEAFQDGFGNPIVGAVVSAHLGDNYKRDINNISYVRQGAALAYPTGYSIYKVYTNGYIKTFYKTDGRDGSDKPYYEHARDQISAEAGFAADILSQFWLGSNGNRNFTYMYPFIPGVAPRVLNTTPASSEGSVSLNRPIYITFNKRMSETNLNNWITISPAAGSITANFVDSNRTILKVNHSANFTAGQTYTVRVISSEAEDEGLTPMAEDYVFTFNTTGSTVDLSPPTAYINPLSGNQTDDPFPIFTGIASDESGVANIEYRFDNGGSWNSAEAIDGTFDSSSEVFKIVSATSLDTGIHALWLRTTDGAGNTSSEGSAVYSFTITEDKPTINFKIDGDTVLPGDPISATPKIEITISSAASLESGRLTIDSSRFNLSFARLDSNYYTTREVTTALSDGIHGITIEAFDIEGKAATYEVNPLYVQSAGELTIQGVPLNYPNPFDPGVESTTIAYTLSKAGNITLSIFDLSGNIISKKSFSADLAGGRAGYNEVTWDGRADNGSIVGNGIYIYLVIADGKVARNGKGKIAVFKR